MALMLEAATAPLNENQNNKYLISNRYDFWSS